MLRVTTLSKKCLNKTMNRFPVEMVTATRKVNNLASVCFCHVVNFEFAGWQ